MKLVYFDHNATTDLDQNSLNEFIKVSQKNYNNSAIHSLGREANSIVDGAKIHILENLNANKHEVIFTSGGTESNNLIVQNFSNEIILTSYLEHSSILKTAEKYSKKLILLNLNQRGKIDIDDFINKISKIQQKGFLVSVLFAHNESGIIQNIKEIAEITHKYGGFLHSDIIQAVGKIKVDIDDLGIDFASISGHKFGAPQGVGCVIKPKKFKLTPMILGGGQEKNQRSGTVNIAAIAAFSKVFEGLERRVEIQQTKVKALKDKLEAGLKEKFNNKITIIGEESQRLPNTILLALENIDSDSQLIFFDMNGFCVSKGSACSSGSSKKSLFLKEILQKDIANYIIRISIGMTNSITDIGKFLNLCQKLFTLNYE